MKEKYIQMVMVVYENLWRENKEVPPEILEENLRRKLKELKRV